MLQDLSLHLEADQQKTVARWVTKTAMALDSTRPHAEESRFYRRDECVGMRTELTIPTRTRIWLGRMGSKIYGLEKPLSYTVAETIASR